ncbi:hypothetical protein [Silvanigrella paludirubra]|nr:hypothetical protein [Silvanigrella paludirubra]
MIAKEFGVSYPSLNSWKRCNGKKDNLNYSLQSSSIKVRVYFAREA